MGLAPALVDWPDTGHHHLIIDAPTPDPNKAIPSKSENHIHLSGGQTELKVDLEPGTHTLQLILGDYSHIPHDPPVVFRGHRHHSGVKNENLSWQQITPADHDWGISTNIDGCCSDRNGIE